MSARSHESITPSNGAILRGWVPFRDDPAGGTARAPSARYFFTVRQSQPASAAISAYDAPASCRTRNLRMFIQFSGCRIIEEITLRCSRLGSRHNEGWSTSQGRQGQSARTPAPGHSARQPHTQPRRPPPPHSRTGPARQGTHPAHPGRHIRSYAIRQQRSYADRWGVPVLAVLDQAGHQGGRNRLPAHRLDGQAAGCGRPAVLPAPWPGTRRNEGSDQRGRHGRLPRGRRRDCPAACSRPRCVFK